MVREDAGDEQKEEKKRREKKFTPKYKISQRDYIRTAAET